MSAEWSLEGGAECEVQVGNYAGGMKGCAGSWVVLGVLWERDGLVRSPFILVLCFWSSAFAFLLFFFSERNIHEITSERASKRLYCATLHYTTPSSYIIHHNIPTSCFSR